MGADPVASAKLLLVSSIIGVAAALLATTVLFPIRVRQRYMMAFSGYLATTDLYLRSFYERVKTGQSLATIEGSSELNQKQMLLEASSKENLYEANPFSSADRESSYDMTTAIKTLHSALVGLRNKQTGARFDETRLDIIDSLIGVISQNIATIRGVLESRSAAGSELIMNEGQDVMHTLESQNIRWDADEGVTQFRIYLKDLLQVHGIVLELGKGIINEKP
jgi:hypothetical protein